MTEADQDEGVRVNHLTSPYEFAVLEDGRFRFKDRGARGGFFDVTEEQARRLRLFDPEASEGISLMIASEALSNYRLERTPAAKIAIVEALLNPHDEFGNPLPPLIDRETALRVLGAGE